MIIDQFANAVETIVERDPRFERDAYFFVRDALDFTTKGQRRKAAAISGGSADAHVTGQQLLEGVRLYAIKQYGPMVLAVFDHWRVRRCEDIGALVFNLIEAHVFGKTDQDTIADFGGGYDFEEAFVKPFQPSQPAVGVGRGRGSRTAAARDKSKSA